MTVRELFSVMAHVLAMLTIFAVMVAAPLAFALVGAVATMAVQP